MSRSPLARNQIRRPFQDWISMSIMQICILTFLAVEVDVSETGISYAQATSRWGGMGSGLEVWLGEWWRIWVTQLHHGDVLHLACNMWAFLFFARFMEQRMGAWKYSFFLLGAAGFAGVFQTLSGPLFVGLSGVICAQLGWIISARDHDEKLQRWFSDSWVLGMVSLLFLGFPLSWWEFLPIGNAAHFFGLLYGLLWGMFPSVVSSGVTQRILGVGLHLLLIPGVFLVTHPRWNAEYYWNLADHAQSDQQKIKFWREALDRNPNLAELHLNLAMVYFRLGNPPECWEEILAALKLSPADPQALEQAQFLAASGILSDPSLVAENRAERMLEQTFGKQADDWKRLLRGETGFAQTPKVRSEVRPAPLPEDLKSVVPWKLEVPDKDRKLVPPDPDDEGSAAAGEAT